MINYIIIQFIILYIWYLSKFYLEYFLLNKIAKIMTKLKNSYCVFLRKKSKTNIKTDI